MTGRELIVYILQNNLEDAELFKSGFFSGFMTQSEAAIKFGVGTATIRMWHFLGVLKSFEFGSNIFVLKDCEDPRKTMGEKV